MGLRRAARRSAIPGADWRRAARLSRGAARFRAPVRTAPRGFIGLRGAIPGAGARRAARLLCGAVQFRARVRAAMRALHGAARFLAPRSAVTAQLNVGSTQFRAQVRAAR